MTDLERIRLAKLGKKLGRKALGGVAAIVKPDTILQWFRRLVVKKYTPSNEGRVGRPTIDSELEDLIVAVAMANRTWGTIGLSALSRISVTRSATRQLATSSAGMASRQFEDASPKFPGPTSSKQFFHHTGS